MQMTRIVIVLAVASMAMGCVSKREVRTVEDYDYSMSCEALVAETRRLEDLRRDMDDESGFTGKKGSPAPHLRAPARPFRQTRTMDQKRSAWPRPLRSASKLTLPEGVRSGA